MFEMLLPGGKSFERPRPLGSPVRYARIGSMQGPNAEQTELRVRILADGVSRINFWDPQLFSAGEGAMRALLAAKTELGEVNFCFGPAPQIGAVIAAQTGIWQYCVGAVGFRQIEKALAVLEGMPSKLEVCGDDGRIWVFDSGLDLLRAAAQATRVSHGSYSFRGALVVPSEAEACAWKEQLAAERELPEEKRAITPVVGIVPTTLLPLASIPRIKGGGYAIEELLRL